MRLLQAARGASLTPDDAHPDDAHPQDPARADPPAAAPAHADDRPGRRPRTLALLFTSAALVLALDVVTKVLVVARLEGQDRLELLGGQLLIQVSRNPGAAFSFAQGATVVFTLIAVAVIVVILRVAKKLGSTGWALALGLLLGGAAGNLVDRLLRAPGFGRGAVVDFIDFQVWPSFNVADSAIVCGGVLAVLLSLRGIELDGRRTSSARAD